MGEGEEMEDLPIDLNLALTFSSTPLLPPLRSVALIPCAKS